MVIEKNKVVSLHYRLQEDDAQGNLVEETFGSSPLVFLFGAGQMLPAFERELQGKATGDEFSFSIESREAYGESDPSAIIEIPISAFEMDGGIPEGLLLPGKMIPMSDDKGNKLNGIVRELTEEGVVMDFNHPMAGQDLFFSILVQDVRAATQEEIEHGHVHGPGGHHH
ncbi:MAG: peptidylprolyl isomerase [Saprospiraceae bacterium]|nr:peptidylprolyl isomerase [Saprospiraceae bacterium]